MTYENMPTAVGGEREDNMGAIQVLLVTDFGPNNKGTIGRPLSDAERRNLAEEASDEKYRRRTTNRWICVDTRRARDADSAPLSEGEADPQTAGGIVITDVAASFMAGEGGMPISQRLASTTKQAVADGLRPVVHGDSHKGIAGCGANGIMCDRRALRSNAINSDTVAPLAWASCTYLGLDRFISQQDIMESIIIGKTNADNDSLWDIKPEQATDIMISNGSEYEELAGDHDEAFTRADFSNGAFDKAAFAADHTTTDDSIGAFSASFGALRNENYRRAKLHGESDRQAALKTMRSILFNIGVCKELGNDDLFLVAVGTAE